VLSFGIATNGTRLYAVQAFWFCRPTDLKKQYNYSVVQIYDAACIA
jgi:hypothetical protein